MKHKGTAAGLVKVLRQLPTAHSSDQHPFGAWQLQAPPPRHAGPAAKGCRAHRTAAGASCGGERWVPLDFTAAPGRAPDRAQAAEVHPFLSPALPSPPTGEAGSRGSRPYPHHGGHPLPGPTQPGFWVSPPFWVVGLLSPARSWRTPRRGCSRAAPGSAGGGSSTAGRTLSRAGPGQARPNRATPGRGLQAAPRRAGRAAGACVRGR